MKTKAIRSTQALGAFTLFLTVGLANAQNIINDDQIVIGGLCVGEDCTGNEIFVETDLRINEDNIRILFDDTSTGSNVTKNDWAFAFNDANIGGSNYFRVTDLTGNKDLFTVEAGGPDDALFVSQSGNVGLGTSMPNGHLHLVSGNQPRIRFEQDGRNGSTPQTYDLGGDDLGFFIQDITTSFFPIQMRPGAPNNSIFIAPNGDVGHGTVPAADLHVFDETRDGPDLMLKLENEGAVQVLMDNAISGKGQWLLSAGNSLFFSPTTKASDRTFALEPNGNAALKGTLTQGSDRHAKTNIIPVDTGDILSKVQALTVSHWTYMQEAEDGITHIGPMAQDFYATFGTGASETGISTLDSSGVALAAIQALSDQKADQDEIHRLKSEIRSLRDEIEQLKLLLKPK